MNNIHLLITVIALSVSLYSMSESPRKKLGSTIKQTSSRFLKPLIHRKSSEFKRVNSVTSTKKRSLATSLTPIINMDEKEYETLLDQQFKDVKTQARHIKKTDYKLAENALRSMLQIEEKNGDTIKYRSILTSQEQKYLHALFANAQHNEEEESDFVYHTTKYMIYKNYEKIENTLIKKTVKKYSPRKNSDATERWINSLVYEIASCTAQQHLQDMLNKENPEKRLSYILQE